MKRKFMFASLGALLLFILYTLAQLIFGIIQTFLYRPQFAPDDFVLQSEVAFGFIVQRSPLMIIGIYILLTLLLFALLMLKKERREQN
ncbi:hypothetical protein H9635_16015 [Solibacillus sp. A46]|uniref:Uncharacterized protein n=1 Tax=Solibacillus faecavium TaxID=2762221 RepID=A0ABR8Y226_9BACL|nr:hypothetical protein [Solibacillus faecavium]MBD8038260.1 hypothetical protein [Solibacillus faecavium]